MKKHTISNINYLHELIGINPLRSFTPVIKDCKRFNLPSMFDENNCYKVNIKTEKKYSILAVPKSLPKEINTLQDTNHTPNMLNTLKTPNKLFSETPSQLSSTRNDKLSIAKICKIKKSYRSAKNPNEETLKIELEKLQQQNLTNNQKICQTDILKEEAKSDIEKILESQEFLKNKRVKQN